MENVHLEDVKTEAFYKGNMEDWFSIKEFGDGNSRTLEIKVRTQDEESSLKVIGAIEIDNFMDSFLNFIKRTR